MDKDDLTSNEIIIKTNNLTPSMIKLKEIELSAKFYIQENAKLLSQFVPTVNSIRKGITKMIPKTEDVVSCLT